jgi:hypothetical protein
MRTLVAIAIPVSGLLCACAEVEPTQPAAAPAVTSSTISTLQVNARASAAMWVQASAIDPDGRTAFEQTVPVAAGGAEAVAMALPAGHFMVAARIYADEALTDFRGQLELPLLEPGDIPMLIKLTLAPDGSPAALVSDRAPRVSGVDVTITDDGRAILAAHASDPDGDRLSIYWGSPATPAGVRPGDALVIDPASAADHSPTAYLTVQDDAGATASARVVFTPDGSCALCGGAAVQVAALPPVDEPCAAKHTTCIAGCDADTPGHACADDCAIALTLCRAMP